MNVRKFTAEDAQFERSPGQDGDIFAANVIDERHGGPVSLGFGRYGGNQTLTETMAVDDTMVILEGRITVESEAGVVTAGPGEMIYMPKGQTVSIRSHEDGALTAYVTYPHWRTAG